MRCESFEYMLPLYLEGELQSTLLRNMKEHAASCEHCRLLLEELHSAEVSLSDMPADNPLPPPGLEKRIMENLVIREKRDPVRILSVALSVLSAFSFLVVTITSFGLEQTLYRNISLIADILRQNNEPVVYLGAFWWPLIGFGLFCAALVIFSVHELLKRLGANRLKA